MPELRQVVQLPELADGQVAVVEAGEDSILVCRVDGQVYACENICSHDQSPLDQATLEGFELLCPRHEGRFDVRTGKATRFPALWPIDTYAVVAGGTSLTVELP